MGGRHPSYPSRKYPDPLRHDGGLPHAAGASNYQVTRANRHRPELCEGLGWTYNHAPDLTYWNGRFYLQYLSVPAYEHVAPSVSLLCSSADGIGWTKPEISFPVYEIPSGRLTDADGREHIIADGVCAVMHQRAAFYQFEGRLFVLGFYGNSDTPPHNPFTIRGIGRVIREIYADGGMSEIYFIRHNPYAGWSEDRLLYPMYDKCPDPEFVRACEAILADRLYTNQWIDEQGRYDDIVQFKEQGMLGAFNWYTVEGESLVGLWKWGMTAFSDDGGKTWDGPKYSDSLLMPGSKVWGEKTSDGRFAVVTTPTNIQNCRWPLAAVTSGNGYEFDNMLCIHGEVPDQRYHGHWKSYGPQYMRGIQEGHKLPPDGAMYIVYSMNKEDIWITRVPAPLSDGQEAYFDEDFSAQIPDSFVEGWNVYSPMRAPVRVKNYGGKNLLELRDSESCDYARAEKNFKKSVTLTFETRVQINRADGGGELWIELCGENDDVAAAVVLNRGGCLCVWHNADLIEGPACPKGDWLDIKIDADCETQRFTVSINGNDFGHIWRFTFPVTALSRVVYRTGRRRFLPNVYSDPDSKEYVKDISPEEDMERCELIALVDRAAARPGRHISWDIGDR